MDELLKQVLTEIKDIKQGQLNLEKGQFNLTEKVNAFESQVNNRFDKVDTKLDSVYDAVADLIEFRTEAEQKLKMIK